MTTELKVEIFSHISYAIKKFFLIPVAIVTQEELITSVFIFSHLKYSPTIKTRHPGAKRWSEYVCFAFIADFTVSYLLTTNTYFPLMLQTTKITEFIVAHTCRLLDGMMFLLINTCVMLLQRKDVLGLFLNFAALMFLQEIDNIALKVCLDGYFSRSLQECAQDVVDMKFAKRHHYTHKCMKSFFVALVWLGMLFVWGNVHWGNVHLV